MSEQLTLIEQALNSGAVWGALIGSGFTAAFGIIAYIWRLHTTATTNKQKLDDHIQISMERDKHLDTKIDNVDKKVEKVDGKVDKLTDKMDGLVDAHHKTQEILVSHVSHEEAQEKMIDALSERLNKSESNLKVAGK